ncbi:MAG TPA: hypothetical protein VHE12_08925 [bacterium]|nr:hypothetical protein [bacterium]
MKRIYILVSVLLVAGLAAGGYYWFQGRSTPPAPDNMNSEEAWSPQPTVPIPATLKHPLTAPILRDLNVAFSESESNSIDDAVAKKWNQELFKLKGALASFIEAKLNENPASWKTLEECRAQVVQELQDALNEASGIVNAQDGTEGLFFNPIDPASIRISQVKDHPDWVAVTTTAEVNCGSDTSFYLFQKKGNGYQLVLRQEDDDPKSTGQEGMDYAISTPDDPKDFFLVLAYGAPWCTSCWGGVQCRVLKPGPDADHPKVLLDKGFFTYRCGPRNLTAGKDDFLLTYTASQTLDLELFSREATKHYRIVGDKAVLTGPLGQFPQDFLDEWVNLSWEEAEPFCVEKGKAELKDWHEKIKNSKGTTSILFVQTCPDPSRWEIGIETDDHTLPSRIYFEVIQKGGDLLMEEVRKDRRGDCPGETTPVPHPGETE